MIQHPTIHNNNDHFFVLPLNPSIPLSDEDVDKLSTKIHSLPINEQLTPHQRRFINIMVPMLFCAGLFLSAVTIYQLTDLFKQYTKASNFNHHGVAYIINNCFHDSPIVNSGIYQVERLGEQYRFQFNVEVLPLIFESLKPQ